MFKEKKSDPLSIQELYDKYKNSLDLTLLVGKDLSKKIVKEPQIERPGLSLAGYLKGHSGARILLFGTMEVDYLMDLPANIRLQRLEAVLTKNVPALVITSDLTPPKEFKAICKQKNIPLFVSTKKTTDLFNLLNAVLSDAFSPSASCHGTLVEAFGVGLLIQGDSSVGKSEAALGLIERGHRLISDDVVRIYRKEGGYLEGIGPELTRHLLEIRGIGIINVANIYGAVCVSEKKRIDLIVKLESWDDNHFYDRVGLEENYCDVLGIKVLYHILPVKPGRDVVLLLETIVLNHRLKGMGYNSAKEFNIKLLETIAKREQERKLRIEAHADS